MKSCPVGTMRTEGRTGTRTKRTKLIVASYFFGNFANVRKYRQWCWYNLHCCVDKASVVSDGKCQVMKMYLGVKVEIHAFLALRQQVIGTAQ